MKKKIIVLAIAVLALNAYVTRATSVDPLESVEMDDMKNGNEDTRTKRSGEIFSSIVRTKLGLLNSLAGSSAGKSIGPVGPIGPTDHFGQPLTYHTKAFNIWGVKKAIMSSVLQAAKAITGGVIAIKGQLLKAKGHVVVAKGKLLQTKGDAISNFGKTIATHAFDVHHQPEGLFGHLPVTPIHQPTSYGAPAALGYEGQVYSNNVYPSNVYPSNGYQNYDPGYSTGYAPAGFSGNGYNGKRAVQNGELMSNQVKSASDKDSVRAGLLIFKPIQMPQSLPGGNSASQSIQQIFGQQPSQSTGGFSGSFKSAPSFGFQNPFPGFQGGASVNSFQSLQANRFSPQQVPNYLTQNSGYPGGFSGFSQFPANSGGNGGESVSVERIPSQGFGLQEYNFNQQANSQEFNGQATGFSGQRLQLPSYSQENFGSTDLHDSASDSEEHIAQPTYKHANKVDKPKQTKKTTTEADGFPADFFLPTTARYEDKSSEGTAKKRSTPKKDEQESRIVPLKYHDDSKPEDQAKLKQTVQRFFSMLQKQRCKY